MISESISEDIPPQMKILNMVIPIPYQHFSCKKTVKMFYLAPTSSGCQLHKNARQLHIITCQRNEVEFATVYHRIYCRKLMTLSNQTLCCIYKCIRMSHLPVK